MRRWTTDRPEEPTRRRDDLAAERDRQRRADVCAAVWAAPVDVLERVEAAVGLARTRGAANRLES